jgi:internalin A
LSPLAGLTSLQSLNLSWCEKLSGDLTPLAGLTSLQGLNLAGCDQVGDHTPLAKLAALQWLDLGGCRQISNLSPLVNLTLLEQLGLSGCDQVSDIFPLAKLTVLRELNLSGCEQLSDLAPLVNLTALQRLNISCCHRLSYLSPLATLTGLQQLNLHYCKGVRQFCPLKPLLPKLQILNLAHCKFDDLPAEVCGKYDWENVVGKVRAHYEDLKSGQRIDAEVKVFLLGNGGVGKTQLCRRLRGLEFDDENVSSTHGIQLSDITLSLEGFSEPVRLNFWDFGGQEIYHGSHALFLHGQAIFLILWTPELECQTAYQEGELSFRHRPLSYWLYYVRTFAGTDASVLIVQSQCDTRDKRILHPPAPVDDFPFHRSIEVSARTGLNLGIIKENIKEAVRDRLDRRPPPPIGARRLKVRDRLRGMLEDDQKREPAQRQHRLLEREEFDRLCDEVGGVSDREALLDFLHHNGVIFYRPGLFRDRIILDQNWALEAIYALFDRKKILLLLRGYGRFNRADLETFIWSEYTPEEQKVFLGMMESCGICFKARELPNDEWEYIASELLPKWSEAQKSLLAGRIPKGHPMAQAEARYAFLHEGILRGYISRIGQQAGDAAIYWKYGCWSYEETTDSRVLIEGRWDDAGSEAGAGSIRLRAWGENAETLIDPLLEALQTLPVGQPPEIKRTKTISAHAIIRSSASVTVRFVSASSVAQPPDIVEHAGSKQVDRPAQIKLEDLIFAQDPIMKDFFISYTRTDQPWAEWIAWKLEEAGYSTVIQVWDFRPGSNFVLEMQNAATIANRTIAVLSPKYLESSFTQPEWAAAFAQDPQGKKQKLIPIRVAPCELTGILAPIVYLDLVSLPEEDARAALLGAFTARNKPPSAPAFPGGAMQKGPGGAPAKPFPAEDQTTSLPITQSLENLVSSTQQNRQASRLSPDERLALIRQLNAMLSQHFNMLVVTLNPEPGLIPEMPAPQADRSVALVRWAETPGGCGLSVLQKFSRSIPDPR